MKAYVLHGKKDLRLEDQTMPEVKTGQVLIKTTRVGICGTDIHYYMEGRAGASIPKRPFIFGHEVTGEIVSAGKGAENLKPGTRVAIDPTMPCWNCQFCRSGKYNLCRSTAFLGSAKFDPPTDGANREYFVMPAENCFPIPENLDDGQAVMLEPLSVATHAVMRSGNVAGKSILISGGGPIGQMISITARAFGAEKITVTDIQDFARNFALQMGADFSLNPNSNTIKDEIQQIAPKGFDIIFEASGSPFAIQSAIDYISYGGTIVQVGTLPAKIDLPFNMVMEKELQILGSFRFVHIFPLALKQLASGRINLKPLISKVFPFNELPEAIMQAQQKEETMKVQIEFKD